MYLVVLYILLVNYLLSRKCIYVLIYDLFYILTEQLQI